MLRPDADLSLYASWSKSFLPQSGDQFSSLTPGTAARRVVRGLSFSAAAALQEARITRIDAAAFVALTRQIKLQLNVENVANRKYIGLSHTDDNLTPANPRTLRAALKLAL